MLHARWRRIGAAGAVLAGLFAAGCGSTNRVTPPTGAGGSNVGGGASREATYVGEQVCAGCHTEKHTEWATTKHSQAMSVLVNAKSDTNPACLPCHTVGYGVPSGFKSQAETPNLSNVGCEMCHGPGSEHAAAPASTNIQKLPMSSACGQCHTGTHNPQYDEWKLSDHSVSSFDVHSDTCTPCHTAEGFVAIMNTPTTPTEPIVNARDAAAASKSRQVPGGAPATTNDECWTCHDPHTANPQAPVQLRKPVNTLCRTCHTFRQNQGTAPSSELNSRAMHNPQAEILNVSGAFYWNSGAGIPVASHPAVDNKYYALTLPSGTVSHSDATQGDCSLCHVKTISVPKPTTGSPNITGHTFRPNLVACSNSGCHDALGRASRQTTTPTKPDLDASAIRDGATANVLAFFDDRQAQITARLATVKTALATVKQSKLTPSTLNGYLTAKWDYDLVNNDKSLGIHNWQYTKAVLDECQRIIALLPTS